MLGKPPSQSLLNSQMIAAMKIQMRTKRAVCVKLVQIIQGMMNQRREMEEPVQIRKNPKGEIYQNREYLKQIKAILQVKKVVAWINLNLMKMSENQIKKMPPAMMLIIRKMLIMLQIIVKTLLKKRRKGKIVIMIQLVVNHPIDCQTKLESNNPKMLLTTARIKKVLHQSQRVLNYKLKPYKKGK